MKLFNLAASRHEEIVKTANPLAALGGVAMRLGGAMLRNPGKTLAAGFTGAEIAGGAKKALKQTEVARSSGIAAAPNFVGQGTI